MRLAALSNNIQWLQINLRGGSEKKSMAGWTDDDYVAHLLAHT